MSSSKTTGGTIRWRDLSTGILFLGGLVLVCVLGLIINKNTDILESPRVVRIFLKDTKGLSRGNSVTISGMKVGTVGDMAFTRKDGVAGVVAELEIRAEHFAMITPDAVVHVRSMGMLGDKFVDIERGEGESGVREGAWLAAGFEPGLEDLTASALATMKRVDTLTGELAETTRRINSGEGTLGRLLSSNELEERLLGTVEGLREVTTRVSSGKGLLARLMNDEQMAGRVSSMMENVNSMTTTVDGLASSLKEGKGSLGRLMSDETFYTNIAGLTARADSILALLSDPNGTLGRFSQDPRVYDNLNRSIVAIDSLITDLKANPGRYVKLSLF
jgi:phospholipid/cholesterol/gamma-HCH transport system substrate-binding protein